MWTLKDVADFATAASLVVAAAAFCLSLCERISRERKAEILRWQRVVVFEQIEAGSTSFDRIKQGYLAEVQQYPDFKIPNKDIQNGALKLVLLSLVEARLISKTDDGFWVVNVVSPRQNQRQDQIYDEMVRRTRWAQLMSKLYGLLDRESGKFNIHELFDQLDGKALGYSYEEFDVHIVREGVNRNIFVLDNAQRVWARNKIPKPPQPPKPAPQPEQP